MRVLGLMSFLLCEVVDLFLKMVVRQSLMEYLMIKLWAISSLELTAPSLPSPLFPPHLISVLPFNALLIALQLFPIVLWHLMSKVSSSSVHGPLLMPSLRWLR